MVCRPTIHDHCGQRCLNLTMAVSKKDRNSQLHQVCMKGGRDKGREGGRDKGREGEEGGGGESKEG